MKFSFKYLTKYNEIDEQNVSRDPKYFHVFLLTFNFLLKKVALPF